MSISNGQLTPSDPAVKLQFDTFKQDVTKEATHILAERMPQKILYFNKLVSEKATGVVPENADIDDAAVLENPWLKFVPDKVPRIEGAVSEGAADVNRDNGAEEKEAKAGTKRHRGNSDVTAANSGDKSQSSKKETVYHTPYPAHPQIYRMTEDIKQEVADMIEMAGSVKLFIQLNVPRIEGGNNFGVQIQEEAIQELGRVEDAAFGICNSIVEYFTGRASLIAKILKYPNVQDFKEALRELDEKKWMLLKVTRIDMRNNYALLYDLLCKNWEKVVKPRHADNTSMIY